MKWFLDLIREILKATLLNEDFYFLIVTGVTEIILRRIIKEMKIVVTQNSGTLPESETPENEAQLADPQKIQVTFRHIGAHDTACDCRQGFRGHYCERTAPLHDCNDEVKCTRQCPWDGSREQACSCDKDGVVAQQDMSHFECTLKLINTSSLLEHGKSLEAKLQKQMTKYLRSSNLAKLEEAKVLNISSGGEARFHFKGHRKDGGRVRELLLALVERGRLADFTLLPTHFSFTQEPTLLILRVMINKKENRVRTGQSFTISCSAQGSSGIFFNWYKDGVPVNTSIATRNMTTWVTSDDSGDRENFNLYVEAADPLDEGEYSCQAVDWGVQQCKSVRLSVVQPLRVSVAPMTSTVQKGSNLTIRCFTSNKPVGKKLGYNWTKNKALFPMNPDSEYWEDLYPDGSILKLLNIQKGGAYTCSVAAGSWSGQAASRLDVVDSPLAGSRCPGSAAWPPTAPGLQASAPCPPGYIGIATRLCLLLEPGHGRWQIPDYSDCKSHHTLAITNAFLGLGLGYAGTTAGNTVWEVATSVGGRGGAYPGEAEPLVALLAKVLAYLKARQDVGVLLNITANFVTAVNGLLSRKTSIVNHQTLVSLVDTVTSWSLWWGREAGGTWGHLQQGGVLINTLRVNPLQKRLSVSIPRHGFR
ncbi:uncharacterized protein [Halyomorpha halys]|uniref:uncharacterized protein n=1 Tax=Halyomorpha halys TaxID=286706 RepID=UPI0034D37764